MRDRFLKWLLGIPARHRIVRVKSWVPRMDRYGIGWPTLLVDQGWSRATSTYIWDWMRVRLLFGHRPAPPPKPEISTAFFRGPSGNE